MIDRKLPTPPPTPSVGNPSAVGQITLVDVIMIRDSWIKNNVRL